MIKERIEILGWTDKRLEISDIGGAVELLGNFTQNLKHVTWDKTAIPIKITIEVKYPMTTDKKKLPSDRIKEIMTDNDYDGGHWAAWVPAIIQYLDEQAKAEELNK